MKTVRQLADEIGVSKQSVQKRISREPLCTLVGAYISKENGTKYIAIEGEKIIKSAFLTPNKKSEPATDNRQNVHGWRGDKTDPVYTLIGMLQQELKAKNIQMENKDKQIGELTVALENTTASLHAAQALHAGTMHKQLGAGPGEPQKEDATETAHQEPEKKPGLFARIFGHK